MFDFEVKAKKNNSFNFFLVAISVALSIIPYLNRNFPVSYWSIIIGLWYVDVFVKTSGKFKISNCIVMFSVWITWCLLLRVIGHSTAAWGNYFLLIASIDLIIKSFYIVSNYSEKEKTRLLRFTQIILLAIVLYNCMLWFKDSSEFDNFIFDETKYLYTNKIQSAQFYNMIAFFIGDLLYLYLHETNVKWKIVDLISIVASSFFLIMINPRMNALLITALLCLLILFLTSSKSKSKLITTTLMVLALIIMLVLMKDKIGAIVGPRLKPRIESLLNLLSGKDYDVTGSSMGARIGLQLNSLRTFFSSPSNFLWGAGLRIGYDNYSIIGQHGFITDNLAAYGLFGVAFLIAFFTIFYKNFISLANDVVNKKYIKCILITFLVSAIISNSFCKEVCVSAFLIPAVIGNNTTIQED
ncbi:MAG: hypothetical protein IJ746_07175 [Ruminococcus sp.]|nr:hypothetical protein [Ruminococcus sp.]